MPNYAAGAAGAIHIVLQGKAVSACDSFTWHRHKEPCEHVKRLEAETNASRADYHRGVSGKIRSLAQAVEGALTDRERSCCSGGVYQDRPRHTSRRVLIGTWL